MLIKKILPVLIITILFSVCLLNSKVFATNIVAIDASNTAVTTGNTSGTGASTITITSQSGNNTAKNNVVNTNTSVNNLISANNTANITQNNVSSYNNVANKANTATGLPYTGSNSSIVFIVVAFIGSAIYAYKKIKDYNI